VFDISKAYSEIIKTMFFTAFYAAVVPLGVVFSIIELIALYWLYKYNLLRRTTVKNCIGAELSREMTELLEFVCVIFAAANFIFYVILHGDQLEFNFFTVVTIIGLLVGLLNAFLPMQAINEKYFPVKEDDPVEQAFDQAEVEFDTDYDRENPATS